MKVLSLLLLAAAAGCGTPTIWYRPDVTPAQAHRDMGACRVKASHAPVTTTRQMSGLGAFLSAQIAQGNYLDACMLEAGYQPVSAKIVTNWQAWPKK